MSTAAERASEVQDFDQTLAAIIRHTERYAVLLGEVSDTNLREEVEMSATRPLVGSYW